MTGERAEFIKAVQEQRNKDEISFLYNAYLIEYSKSKVHSDLEIQQFADTYKVYSKWLESEEKENLSKNKGLEKLTK